MARPGLGARVEDLLGPLHGGVDPGHERQGVEVALHRHVVDVPGGVIDGAVIRFVGLESTITDVFARFVWLDGSEWKYTCWMGGQPNNYFEEEHYLATYDGGDWVDVQSEGSGFWMPTGFICEWKE